MRRVVISYVLGTALLLSAPANAGIFKGRSKAPQRAPAEAAVVAVQQALDEQRYLDASTLLTEAALSHLEEPRLTVLAGELDLMRERYSDSLVAFKEAEKSPAVRARALQDEGIALSLLGRSDEAFAALKQSVAQDASLWRAWNALGSEYDARKLWSEAENAYQHALTASGDAAIVLNNRGYSRLLQHRRDEATADFVAALRKKPDLAAARTNLRLALAIGGEYERAVAGGSPAERAALLNNAGFAAAMRGDYADAQALLDQAIKAKGEYYAKASANLRIVETLNSQAKKATNAAP
jgi:tetratricopeptide (TPR) repeat protein